MPSSYLRWTPRSRRMYLRAVKVFAGGVNHNARYYLPYPLFVRRARGEHIWDVDGHMYVDYWMGHMALILGHSPGIVVDAIREQVESGTHFGMSSSLSLELGEEVQRTVPCAELMRFCTTGAEATMYMVRLARARTRKRTVIKMAGGWHGYNTDLNKGVHSPFEGPEGSGIIPAEQEFVKIARFNDLEDTAMVARESRGDLAAILLEPVLGAGGCIPADCGYLRGLRELADRYGAILAFDEIITGFRLALGGAQERYGVRPDLAALGKVAGGGLPLGVVCGLEEIVSMADPSRKGGYTSIGGGTFSENPLSMAAGLATVRYLRRNRERVYPRLEAAGRAVRTGVDRAFEEEGVVAHTTGMGSLFLTHFGPEPKDAEEASRADRGRARDYALDMMTRGVFLLPGHPGAVSTAHTMKDIGALVESARAHCRAAKARRREGR